MHSLNRGGGLWKKLSQSRTFLQLLKHDVLGQQHAAAAAAAPGPWGRSSTRGYYNILHKSRFQTRGSARVVDLRTDASSKPGPAMLQAMTEAAVKADFIREDPLFAELEQIIADMFGMEAVLFVPSGTMGNLVAVMAHCRGRSDEMMVGDLSHMHLFEQGSSAQVAGVHSTTLTTLRDGTFDLDEVEAKIRHSYPSPWFTRSRLVCLENTHNILGGRVMPLNFLQEVRALADQHGVHIHMDGARLMNAAVAQGVSPRAIVQHVHSVSMNLNKGLGGLIGTVLAGSHEFMSHAFRCHYALGGRMCQVGPLLASANVSLTQMVGRLEEDHRHAKAFAQALFDCDPPVFDVDLDGVQTNIVSFHVKDPSVSASDFCVRMVEVDDEEVAALGQEIQVFMNPFYGNSVRAVWYPGISAEDTQLAIQKMQFVASQLSKERRRAQ